MLVNAHRRDLYCYPGECLCRHWAGSRPGCRRRWRRAQQCWSLVRRQRSSAQLQSRHEECVDLHHLRKTGDDHRGGKGGLMMNKGDALAATAATTTATVVAAAAAPEAAASWQRTIDAHLVRDFRRLDPSGVAHPTSGPPLKRCLSLLGHQPQQSSTVVPQEVPGELATHADVRAPSPVPFPSRGPDAESHTNGKGVSKYGGKCVRHALSMLSTH